MSWFWLYWLSYIEMVGLKIDVMLVVYGYYMMDV